ncbi:hypothetical protein CEXT_85252 [Caerostris extrusa]|uniref:Phospholipase A-2-activating protein n=1 Tax=Caerostris extrusa TaxID=172846 RepID=A0AAV4WVC7_CAEEX|nr:hypothetical protein CEXT_85252 [Caerostris extrusa]
MDPSDQNYYVRQAYKGHSADVRVVKTARFPEGGFITGSRDTLVKLWIPLEGDIYKDEYIFVGAKKFIASICSLPPSAQYPEGLILAGSNDCAIYGFTLSSNEPVLKLMGHSDVVCTLSAGYGLFVSGSWDKTARIWSGQQCTAVLEGHSQTVWAVEVYPVQNIIITGSADHTIRIWRHGSCENILYGHSDCVRGLVITRDLNILSCSNDTTVRLWTIQGICLNVFQGHDNYIYGICLLNNGVDFATCGEDEMVKIWKNGICVQTIEIASKTLWSITCLQNGELVVGCSDGSVCIISKPKGSIDSESVKRIDCSELVDKINFYDWDPIKKKWVRVRTSNTKENSGKMELDLTDQPEKIKDFEFCVEIDEKLCKLELNRNEDFYDVGRKFIVKQDVDPSYLGEIMSFIVKNCVCRVPPTRNEFFPLEKYYTYLNANIAGLKAKLLEFTNFVSKAQYIPPVKIENLILLTDFPDQVSESQFESLDVSIGWSDEYLFPALDLLRLVVRCKGVGARIGNHPFINHLLQILRSTKLVVNKILVIKIFCNLFDIKEGEDLMIKFQGKICESVKEAVTKADKTQKSTSSLFLNYAVASSKGFPLDIELYCLHIIQILNVIEDSDSLYRICVSIGTVCLSNFSAFTCFNSLNLYDILLKRRKYADAGNTTTVLKLLIEGFHP